MMDDQSLKKLKELFRRKMEEVYGKNEKPAWYADSRLTEFKAWKEFLRNSLSLEVVDIKEGERSGVMQMGGKVLGVRIRNPSNIYGHGREFIIVPYEFAEMCLAMQRIPDRWLPQN